MRLSIVIPAYNEEARLGGMLDRYLPFFSARPGEEIELIVVVNGSTDGTETLARGYAARWPALRVLVEPAKIGKGGAVRMGFAAARGELIGFVDADGATPPEAFQDLVDHLGPADAIIASRWMPGSVVSPPQPLKRRLASRAFNALVRTLFRLPVSDTQCGAKVLRREAAQTVMPRLGVTQWAFDVDVLFQLRRAGFKLVEHPTVWRDQGGSQLRMGRASLEMFVAVVRLRLVYSPFRFLVELYNRTAGRLIRVHR